MYKRIIDIIRTYQYNILEEDWNNSSKEHPDFPQINAISEIFDQYGITNFIAQVPPDVLDDLPDEFISVVYIDNTTDTAVINKSNINNIIITFFDEKRLTLNKKEFLTIWTGYLIGVEENSNPIVSPANKVDYTKLVYPIAFTSLALLFIVTSAVNNLFSFSTFLLFIINLIGLFLSFLTLRESLGFNSKYVNRICSSIKKGNCNQVVRSSSSFVFKNISLSDLAFIFFMYSSIIAIFAYTFPRLLILNYIFIPLNLSFIIYAFHQQMHVVKKWCILCLGISFVTIAQAFLLIGNFSFQFDLYNLTLTSFTFAFLFMIWFVLKQEFVKYSDLIFDSYHTRQIYKNPKVFTLFFENEKYIAVDDFKKLNMLPLNRTDAELNISFILSPSCEYCRGEFYKIKKLLYYFEHKIRFNIMFNFIHEEIEVEATNFMNRLYETQSHEEQFLESLDDYFIHHYSLKKWTNKWGGHNQDYYDLLSVNNSVLEKYNIFDTPALLINNRLYPKDFKIEDVKYYLKTLLDQ